LKPVGETGAKSHLQHASSSATAPSDGFSGGVCCPEGEIFAAAGFPLPVLIQQLGLDLKKTCQHLLLHKPFKI
jgi:hypothetical protein